MQCTTKNQSTTHTWGVGFAKYDFGSATQKAAVHSFGKTHGFSFGFYCLKAIICRWVRFIYSTVKLQTSVTFLFSKFEVSSDFVKLKTKLVITFCTALPIKRWHRRTKCQECLDKNHTNCQQSDECNKSTWQHNQGWHGTFYPMSANDSLKAMEQGSTSPKFVLVRFHAESSTILKLFKLYNYIVCIKSVCNSRTVFIC